MIQYIPLVILLPALGALVNAFFPRKALARIVGPGVIGLAFLVALGVLLNMPPSSAAQPWVDVQLWMWMPGSKLDVPIAIRVDSLSMLMTLVVTGVGFLIHIYSIGYMADDARYARFFFYMNLFVTAMLTLVLANNYLMMFVGWEGVGLCSYLLIGFWFERPAAANAAKKAFIVNRVGDFAFTIGLLWLFSKFGIIVFNTADHKGIFDLASQAFNNGDWAITWITFLLFIGATGKSAQLPLFVWLPDAMEGPTPVSALIHAATMVTAGVYMIARSHVLFELAPTTMAIVATVGALTALFGATIALVHPDFKRVLAYSTISQIGYMFMAVGVGAFGAGIFHLATHAFFKALMFLGAGSVMHGLANETNIFKMGGLQKYMPITAFTFVIGWLAISGIPPFAGFYSKDDILAEVYMRGWTGLWLIGVLTAALTAFYIGRVTLLAFFGRERFGHAVHPHESPASMTLPLIVLAALSLAGGLALNGGLQPLGEGSLLSQYLAPVLAAGKPVAAADAGTTLTLTVISIGAGVIGILMALNMYQFRFLSAPFFTRAFKPLYVLFSRKYFVDEIYHVLFVLPALGAAQFLYRIVDRVLIDGAVLGGVGGLVALGSRSLHWLQSGYVRSYAFMTLIGAVLLVIFFLFHS